MLRYSAINRASTEIMRYRKQKTRGEPGFIRIFLSAETKAIIE